MLEGMRKLLGLLELLVNLSIATASSDLPIPELILLFALRGCLAMHINCVNKIETVGSCGMSQIN